MRTLGLVVGGLLSAALIQAVPSLAHAGSLNAPRANLTKATVGSTYFNKPGATSEEHAQAVRGCVAVATSAAPTKALTPGLIPAIMHDAQTSARTQANIENCMVARGWKVVRVSESEASKLRGLPQPDLARRLDERFGAVHPTDVVVREFKNEASRGDTIWGAMPAYSDQVQLSVRAVDLSGVKPEPKRKPRVAKRNPGWAVAPLKPEQLSALGADEALVIVRAVGNGQTNGEGFSFVREPAENTPPELGAYDADGRPDTFYAGVRWTLTKGAASEKRELLAGFAVPPGRWRLSQKMSTLDLCLGAPAFDIKAGEVVYIGSLDLVGDLGPDMDPAPAMTLLAPAPDLAAKLRPATWIANTTGICSGVYYYRLENIPPKQ